MTPTITLQPDRIKVTIRKSKTDKDGSGQMIGIANGRALCPVRALRRWLDMSGITTGSVFRIVGDRGSVQPTRLTDPVGTFGSKALCCDRWLGSREVCRPLAPRRLITQAGINGVQELAIMKQTRHKSSDMLRKYTRDGTRACSKIRRVL
jgi:hypothetical protein